LWDLRPVKGLLGFSMAISAAGVVWVFASQFDKLVLSGLLSLAEYGAYGLPWRSGEACSRHGSLADTLIPPHGAVRASPGRSRRAALQAGQPVDGRDRMRGIRDIGLPR
jgi:hypothetical protein